jgi:putative addiction module component (TIGR02574 family)
MARRREVFAEALELPTKQRAALAHELLRSLDDGPAEDPAAVDRSWADEINRRLKEVDAGAVDAVPWSTVQREIKADLAKRRRARARNRKPSTRTR